MATGRNAKGQFVKGHRLSVGNRGGPGRPSRQVEERYLKTLLRVVSQEEWDEATTAILVEAKKGNVSAYRALAAYTVGTPLQRIEARVDVEETLNEDLERALDRILGPDILDGDAGRTD